LEPPRLHYKLGVPGARGSHDALCHAEVVEDAGDVFHGCSESNKLTPQRRSEFARKSDLVGAGGADASFNEAAIIRSRKSSQRWCSAQTAPCFK
jgi:hypothetical protein